MLIALAFIKALVPLAWPMLAAIVVWKLFPAVRSIASSGAFSVKVAGMEISVQAATEQLRLQIEDLQKQVIEMRSGSANTANTANTADAADAGPKPPTVLPPATLPPDDGNVAAGSEPVCAPVPTADRPAVILWVDDKPSSNAFEIAQLEDRNVEIVQSLSTSDAINSLRQLRVDAIISDMSRHEDGVKQPLAGLALLAQARAMGFTGPFMVYSSDKNVDRNRRAVIAAGGDGATASPIELIEWVRLKMGSPGPT